MPHVEIESPVDMAPVLYRGTSRGRNNWLCLVDFSLLGPDNHMYLTSIYWPGSAPRCILVLALGANHVPAWAAGSKHFLARQLLGYPASHLQVNAVYQPFRDFLKLSMTFLTQFTPSLVPSFDCLSISFILLQLRPPRPRLSTATTRLPSRLRYIYPTVS